MPDLLRYRIGSEAEFTDGRWNGRNPVENCSESLFELVLHRKVETGVDTVPGTMCEDFPYLRVRDNA